MALAAVAVVAIGVGVIAVATSGATHHAAAAVAPDRREREVDPTIEAGAPLSELCEAACRSGCGVEGPDCARLCLADPRGARCLAEVGTSDCAAWSRCVLGASCSGEPPRGDATCRDTYECDRACRDNISCSCSCLGRMAPAHALAMTKLSMCALFMCANDAACVQAQCEAPLAACRAR